MPEVTGRIRKKSQVLTFPIDEIVFGKSKTRFCTIPGGNIKIMISGSSKALVLFASCLSILDSTRTSVIKPRLFSIRSKESTWNVRLNSRDKQLCDALGTHRGVSPLEAVVYGKSEKYILRSSHQAEAKCQKHCLFCGSRGCTEAIGQDTEKKVVIGGAQRKEKLDRVCGRIKSKEEVQYVGPISKTVGNTCRVLNQLFQMLACSPGWSVK